MSLQDDKRELLKLKQGLIEESEVIKEEEKPEYEPLKGKKKIENFFYHYKWHVIVITFFVVVAGFLIYDIVAKEKGDARILVLTKDNKIAAEIQYKTKEFETAFEKYCPNFDDNGYIHVDVYNIDLSDNPEYDYMMASASKAAGEIHFGEAQMYIVDTPALKEITEENYSNLINIEELYPDCPQADGYLYKIKDSEFAYMCNYVEACPDDLYIVVRKINDLTANKERAEIANERALILLDNIINGKFDGWEDDQGRIYGIYDEGEIELKPTL